MSVRSLDQLPQSSVHGSDFLALQFLQFIYFLCSMKFKISKHYFFSFNTEAMHHVSSLHYIFDTYHYYQCSH